MNKTVYLTLSMLEMSKTLMYNFWYDYIKPKYQQNAELCYMDTDSFVIHTKTKDGYEDIVNNDEERFDILSYEVNIPSPIEKNKKINWTNER